MEDAISNNPSFFFTFIDLTLFCSFAQNLTHLFVRFKSNNQQVCCLVYTLERRNRLALILVQGGGNDLAVCQVYLAVGLLLEAESVLHPVLVITVRVVLAGVSTTGLLSGGSGSGGLNTMVSHG